MYGCKIYKNVNSVIFLGAVSCLLNEIDHSGLHLVECKRVHGVRKGKTPYFMIHDPGEKFSC